MFDMPKLPDSVRIPEADGASACSWLDEYCKFSKLWAPRTFDVFHEGIGVWTLSTVAARRLYTNLGKKRFTHLYIANIARTTYYTKTTVTEIAIQALHQANLQHFLSADSSTPQRLLYDMSNTTIDNFTGMAKAEREIQINRVITRGQKGWYRGEAGQLVREIMKRGGTMSNFRGIFSELDDAPETYSHNTHHVGSITVINPYLTILFNLTPQDLASYAKTGSPLWHDGFLARFTLISPPKNNSSRARFPSGERIIPESIIQPLIDWNTKLGIPDHLLEDTGEKKQKRVVSDPLPLCELELTKVVEDAFYGYHDGLLDIQEDSLSNDLDGNYGRLAEKTLRMASLFAGINGGEKIEYEHWAKAQTISERFRMGLHNFYRQANTPTISEKAALEERILERVLILKEATAAEVSRYFKEYSSTELAKKLDGMVETGLLYCSGLTRSSTKRYVARTDEDF